METLGKLPWSMLSQNAIDYWNDVDLAAAKRWETFAKECKRSGHFAEAKIAIRWAREHRQAIRERVKSLH